MSELCADLSCVRGDSPSTHSGPSYVSSSFAKEAVYELKVVWKEIGCNTLSDNDDLSVMLNILRNIVYYCLRVQLSVVITPRRDNQDV